MGDPVHKMAVGTFEVVAFFPSKNEAGAISKKAMFCSLCSFSPLGLRCLLVSGIYTLELVSCFSSAFTCFLIIFIIAWLLLLFLFLFLFSVYFS
ncbi:hypothetical protein BX661DRAFT_103635 [Kickxella alabastrina]|uniref:uncharacterized protein n=1 Tax=Kickxella alabastrina TaxID=61397 RepID=UPI00221F1BD7|nr:uncharacterized protein BX661DRAFT_103635 [Kickxella alabastrina]KAI7818902.1 hypothetical protein BX661DRAFT_103635 [Kickxella alabastrina]